MGAVFSASCSASEVGCFAACSTATSLENFAVVPVAKKSFKGCPRSANYNRAALRLVRPRAGVVRKKIASPSKPGANPVTVLSLLGGLSFFGTPTRWVGQFLLILNGLRR